MGSDSRAEKPDSGDWSARLAPDEREHLQRMLGSDWQFADNAAAYLETLRKIRAIESEALNRLKNRGTSSE
jgi:hypothetical protein